MKHILMFYIIFSLLSTHFFQKCSVSILYLRKSSPTDKVVVCLIAFFKCQTFVQFFQKSPPLLKIEKTVYGWCRKQVVVFQELIVKTIIVFKYCCQILRISCGQQVLQTIKSSWYACLLIYKEPRPHVLGELKVWTDNSVREKPDSSLAHTWPMWLFGVRKWFGKSSKIKSWTRYHIFHSGYLSPFLEVITIPQNEVIYIFSHALLHALSSFLRAVFPVALCQDWLYLFFIGLFIIALLCTWIILPPPTWLV